MYVNAAVNLGRLLDGVGSTVDRILLASHIAQGDMLRMASEAGWYVIDFTPTQTSGVDMACYYHPVFNASAAAALGRPWNEHFRHPVRLDGAGNYYKLLAFALTAYKRVLHMDVDVGLHSRPDELLRMSPALPIIMRPVRRLGLPHLGSHSAIFIAVPNNVTLRRLLTIASDGSYYPWTNGEQDVLESAFYPPDMRMALDLAAHVFPCGT